MSNRRRRGRRSARHEAPTRPSHNSALAPDAGRARLEGDEDKAQAMRLDEVANARRVRRSFVLSNHAKLSIVAVCHCNTVSDLSDLKSTLDSLQRTYHPTKDPVRGYAELPPERQAELPRQPMRAGVAIQPRRPRGEPAIEFAQPKRAPKLIVRGTLPPDEQLERGHVGRYEQQADYEGEV